MDVCILDKVRTEYVKKSCKIKIQGRFRHQMRYIKLTSALLMYDKHLHKGNSARECTLTLYYSKKTVTYVILCI